jgi:hypothetical protein
MGRWGLLTGLDIGADGDPYLDRLRLVDTPWFGVFLHHIHRPDKDDHPHDHPWSFWRLVLCGGYTELFWPDKANPAKHSLRERRRWSCGRVSRKAAHIITDVSGPLWTLVFTGRENQDEWGFWVQGKYVPWREYLGMPPAAPGGP